jgi:hypothetical protein
MGRTVSTTSELVERLKAIADNVVAAAYNADPWHTEQSALGQAEYLRAAAARLGELERENARLKTPEWFYNADDGEYTYGDVSDVADDMGHEGVMRVGGAREVWKKWAAVRCVALDADGDVDETEIHTFDTEAEALRCWPESFAAARAALAGSGEK